MLSINDSFPVQDRLVANEFIQCRKVCEHVLEKVLNAETTPSGGNASNSLQNSQSDANSEGSQLPAEERIELWCNDVVSTDLISSAICAYTLFELFVGC